MQTVVDFSDPEQVAAWQPVNDVVMGGCSQSQLRIGAAGTGLFSGRVSFDNGGGFASVRCNRLRQSLTGSSGLRLRFRGDGKSYKFNLRTDTRLDSINWQVRFTATDAWQEQSFTWAEFRPTRHGRELPETPPLEPAAVVGLGLLIADRQEGEFCLELTWIKTCD